MKILSKALTAVAGVAAVSAAMITDAQAVPSFARQTGMACVSCHSGNYPALNAFGRAFLTSGYTMRGAAPLVEGEDLSIPGISRGHHTIKHIHPARDAFNQVLRRAHAHQVAWMRGGHEGRNSLHHLIHDVLFLTDAQTTNGVALESDVRKARETVAA